MLFGIGPFDIIGIVVFILIIMLLPWLLRTRAISSVSKVTLELEQMVGDAKKILVSLCQEKGKSSENPTEAIENFMEFFIIPPVDLDPYGIVKKFEKILDLGEDRFKQMVNSIAPNADSEWRSNIIMTLKATIGINGVAKLVRHNLELARKTGNLQILLMLQMSLPLIMRIVRAQFEGTKAFSEGKPIGDGLGPLVAGMLMKGFDENDIDEMDDLIVFKRQINDHNVTIARAKGPGGRIGKIGKVVSSIIDQDNIKKIITVDAAVKLEGEETGKVAEGVGVVIGGVGVDRWTIEEEIVKKDIDLDAVIVKMSPEEAISNMNHKIADAAQKALKAIERSISSTNKDFNILVIGVGNSSGIPNIISDISQLEIKKEIEGKK
jgi:hypothetical protein